jgi:hypothetical protein
VTWPPPIKIKEDELPAGSRFINTLASGERIYIQGVKVYAVQPQPENT